MHMSIYNHFVLFSLISLVENRHIHLIAIRNITCFFKKKKVKGNEGRWSIRGDREEKVKVAFSKRHIGSKKKSFKIFIIIP